MGEKRLITPSLRSPATQPGERRALAGARAHGSDRG